MQSNLNNTAVDTTASSGDIKLSVSEKICYGLGNTSAYIIYTLMGSLLTFFYTDYVGISAGIVGSIFLISRVFDGVSDVIMGHITDHTHSKFGKARAWLLWMAVPYFITGIALFLIPADAPDMMQYVYIFITYNLANTVVYTATNLPYGTLATLMTRGQHEREVLNVFRMALGPFGGLLITACTLPLVKKFGDNQMAWILVMGAWMILGTILQLITFFKCKERVHIEAAKKSDVPFLKSLKALLMNKYWLISMLLWCVLSVYGTFNGTSLPYYCKNILGDSVISSPISTCETLIQIVVIACMPKFLQKFGKRNCALAGAILVLIAQIPLLIAPTELPCLIVSAVLRGVGVSPLFAVVFSFLADSVEYGQWRTHLRTEGMVMSAASLGSKVGGGFASAIVGKILTSSGYDGMASVQSASANAAVSGMYRFAPLIIWGAAVILLLCYQLDKKYPKIMADLKAREEHGEL